ncbi:MAG: PA2779 family protein [Desulfobacteraceae bacterium]|jgi:hypothetical protein
MKRSIRLRKFTAILVSVAFCFLSVVVAPVQATLVGTSDILAAHENDMARDKVKAFVAREDVANHLEALGVSVAEAQTRVDTMTAEEIQLLADKIDEMPAGGDALGFILAISVIAFIVLIITDIIGVTDVFTFIKKR